MAYESSKIENVIKVIPLSQFTEIRVTQIGDEKVTHVDVRQWFCTQKNPQMTPTQKGFRIGVDNVQELIDAIKQAAEL